MKLKATLFAMVTWTLSLSAMAQVTVGTLPPLHVDGNQLKDEQGNIVVLHGVMDTPSPYFNNYRWGGACNDGTTGSCVSYFGKLFTAITNPSKGTYCNLFRLHLDCCWTHVDLQKDKDGNVIKDEDGNPVNYWEMDSREIPKRSNGTIDYGSEAYYGKYQGERLTKYLKSVYTQIARRALMSGLYVIMRPPGVCPGDIYVGGSYQKYLLDVWDRVTKNSFVLENYGVIGIELANEPVRVHLASGSDSPTALHDFFQPIVDKIRENGFKGIIWVPGSGWQSSYADYAKYPIQGDQIGFAVHDYEGWYGTSDNSYNHQNAINQFGKQVPVVGTNPIVITEIDWSPYKEGTGHYNEHGDWVLSNYGTWATGHTSKWGGAYKATLDYYGNISMTLSGTACYIDIDDYINKRKVTPAFKTAMEANGLDPHEGCGVACFEWYKDYAQVNYPSTERYQPKQEVPQNPLELSDKWFKPNILYAGTARHATAASTLTLKQGGFSGWRFEEEEGVDLSDYKYIVIKLLKNSNAKTYFRIYDTANYWAEPYIFDMSSAKEFKIDLQNAKTTSGEKLDLTHIRLAGFNSQGSDQALYVKELFLSNDGETPAPLPVTAISAPAATGKSQANDVYFDLSGRRVTRPTRGIYIQNGKKVYVK